MSGEIDPEYAKEMVQDNKSSFFADLISIYGWTINEARTFIRSIMEILKAKPPEES